MRRESLSGFTVRRRGGVKDQQLPGPVGLRPHRRGHAVQPACRPMMIRAVLPHMRRRRFGRIVNITSAMVTTPRPHIPLSSGARAGLTGALKGLSLDVARDNVTINNLLPERFDTDRQQFMAKRAVAREGISYEEARARQVASIVEMQRRLSGIAELL
jgi:NAD(P)-dependent dehydrogenase (short-subunit alcohol dehydrogenase family)